VVVKDGFIFVHCSDLGHRVFLLLVEVSSEVKINIYLKDLWLNNPKFSNG
jgi:hypothetical protein